MREILFKAKTAALAGCSYNNGKDDGEWVQGYFYDDVGCFKIRQFELDRADYISYEIDPATLCQYTGLTDKNGVKIFEGDILQACDYPKDSLTFPVVWYEKHAGFNLMGLNTIAFNIIGNIHDKEHNNG